VGRRQEESSGSETMVVSLARDTATVRVELVEDYDFGLEGGDFQAVAVTGDQ
jgi:hypothetical protein